MWSYSPQTACMGNDWNVMWHLTAIVSHMVFKFLTKPFVLQTSKKLITTRHDKVPFFYLFYLCIFILLWSWPLIALLSGQRVILFDFPFHLPGGYSGLKTFLHIEACLTGNLSNYGKGRGSPVKYWKASITFVSPSLYTRQRVSAWWLHVPKLEVQQLKPEGWKSGWDPQWSFHQCHFKSP